MRQWLLVWILVVGCLGWAEEMAPPSAPIAAGVSLAEDQTPATPFTLLEAELRHFSSAYTMRPSAGIALATAGTMGLVGSVLLALGPTIEEWGPPTAENPEDKPVGYGGIGVACGALQLLSVGAILASLDVALVTEVRAREAYASVLDTTDPEQRDRDAVLATRALSQHARRKRLLMTGTAIALCGASVAAYYYGVESVGYNSDTANVGIGYAATVAVGGGIALLAGGVAKTWPERLYANPKMSR